jgi:hypothetical protein
MDDKTRFITPLLMLFAGAVSSIIMYLRGYEFTKMLWILLIVLVIFYFIGDTARYIYSGIRPRIIPEADYSEMEKIARSSFTQEDNNVKSADDEKNEEYEEDNEDNEEEYEESDEKVDDKETNVEVEDEGE